MSMIQQFTPFTGAQWEKLLTALHEKTGIEINAFSGQQEAKGITLRWDYDPTKQLLEIQLMNRSWYDPSEATIDQEISKLIEGIMQ